MKKKVLFVNGGAGRAKRGRELETLVAAAEKQPDLQVHIIKKHDNLPRIISGLIKQGVEVIGAAGGDGTINYVASSLVNTKVPLVVIPFGTLNHFARDIGVPGNLEEALTLFEQGDEISIDVGEVNGKYFLNNSSIGIYPRLVKQREKHEKQLGKWLAYMVAGWNVLRHPTLLQIKLAVNGEVQNLKVGLVFFSNNRADMSPLGAGHRERLNDQILDTYLVKAATPFELFRVATSFLRNKLEQSPLVTKTEVFEAVIYSARRYLHVACDGEAYHLPPPLQYKIHPEALRVKIPVSQEESKKDYEPGTEQTRQPDITTVP